MYLKIAMMVSIKLTAAYIMKGTEVLTLGAVGVINLYTQVYTCIYILLSCSGLLATCHHGLATSVG